MNWADQPLNSKELCRTNVESHGKLAHTANVSPRSGKLNHT
jgi:hypothetical protein